MARRRRITAAESRVIRRIVLQSGISRRAALRQFRQAGYKIADSIFREVFDALRSGFVGNINKARRGPLSLGLKQTVTRNETVLERLGREIGDAMASQRISILAQGFSTGTAQLRLENRRIDVPWTTQIVTVHFGLTMARLGEAETLARDRIRFATRGHFQQKAALQAIRAQGAAFVEAVKRYGRIELAGPVDSVLTKISAERAGGRL